MELDKESIIKTAFDLYCNKIYNREYPLTVNNLRKFLDDICQDFNDYFGVDINYFRDFDFNDTGLRLIISQDCFDDTDLKQYLHHFINTHSIPF